VPPDTDNLLRPGTDQWSILILLAALANKVHQDPLDPQETTVRQERTPTEDKMETTARKDKFLPVLCLRKNLALFAQPDHQALSDSLARRDLLDQKESQQRRPTTERRETKACQDPKAFQDLSDPQEALDRKASQAESSKSTDQLDHLANADLQAELGQRALQEKMATSALKDHREKKETSARLAHKETKDRQAQSDHKENPVQKALAITAHLHAPHPAIKQLTGEQTITSDLLYKPIQLVHRLLSLLFILMCQSSHHQLTKSINSHSRTS